jgi:hypothetical protein
MKRTIYKNKQLRLDIANQVIFDNLVDGWLDSSVPRWTSSEVPVKHLRLAEPLHYQLWIDITWKAIQFKVNHCTG